MSSNIRVKKICQHCNKSFIAKTTVTKFCSDDCAKRNYKKRQKQQKITNTILDTNYQLIGRYHDSAPVHRNTKKEKLPQEYVSISSLSEILGIAERSLFRAIKAEGFPKLKIGRRLLFNKQQVVDYFISKSESI
ncbi:MAG TPA: helix-turn-helix domain-containing protein [Chitinophagaceae bacterium]|nr:helix-turn-helix domain-containing protein [Chitinophagaceae bacterium]